MKNADRDWSGQLGLHCELYALSAYLWRKRRFRLLAYDHAKLVDKMSIIGKASTAALVTESDADTFVESFDVDVFDTGDLDTSSGVGDAVVLEVGAAVGIEVGDEAGFDALDSVEPSAVVIRVHAVSLAQIVELQAFVQQIPVIVRPLILSFISPKSTEQAPSTIFSIMETNISHLSCMGMAS